VAHQLLYDFVRDLSQAIEFPEPIVEFGSMQVEEGQPNDLRELFSDRDFVGTDFREGPGVDRVEDLRHLTFADGEVGTALCLDTLEHCADPITACRELQRVVADGGVCVISSVWLIGVHAHPSDYWRFTPEGFRLLLEGFDDSDVAGWGDPDIPYFVFGAATNGRPLGVDLAGLPSLAEAQESWRRAEGQVRVGPFRYPLRDLARLLGSELPRAVGQRARARLGS
jgi:hypothetical protein